MKLWLIGALVVAIAASATSTDALAKRMGSGRSYGMQRSMPARTAPDATPAKPAAPAQQAAPTSPTGAPAAPAPAAPRRSWMGPLAGLAAGLGLAALMSHFGLGEGLAQAMTFALLAGVAVFGVMFLLRRFGPGARSPALAGAGAAGAAGTAARTPWPAQPAVEPPFERSAPDLPAATPAALAATPAVARAFVPAAFDAEGFARTAKMIFIRLQAANDAADLDDLRRFTTPELFAALRLELQERGSAPQQTDVVKVDAEVLDVAHEAERQVVSVRFHGQVVEEKGAAATDFNEVWHLVKAHDESQSWVIAGIEQMN
jgi:predicted lipid-binding transport protein (Tim44 family)